MKMLRVKPVHSTSTDIHPAFIRAELAVRGMTLTALAHKHGKEASYYRSALSKPFPAALLRLARAIGKRPHALWPSLFDEQDKAIRARRTAGSTTKVPTSGRRRPQRRAA
jgi:lambda repressor-like predicted transcriptional regulator